MIVQLIIHTYKATHGNNNYIQLMCFEWAYMGQNSRQKEKIMILGQKFKQHKDKAKLDMTKSCLQTLAWPS